MSALRAPPTAGLDPEGRREDCGSDADCKEGAGGRGSGSGLFFLRRDQSKASASTALSATRALMTAHTSETVRTPSLFWSRAEFWS